MRAFGDVVVFKVFAYDIVYAEVEKAIRWCVKSRPVCMPMRFPDEESKIVELVGVRLG